MLKMMAIAGNRHFRYDNEFELVQFIASEMGKEGLDEENLDSYLTAIYCCDFIIPNLQSY
jgi:hypothetical protein